MAMNKTILANELKSKFKSDLGAVETDSEGNPTNLQKVCDDLAEVVVNHIKTYAQASGTVLTNVLGQATAVMPGAGVAPVIAVGNGTSNIPQGGIS